MILTSLLTVVLVSFTGTTSAQQTIIYDSIHNVTAITGTWSSGNKVVLTGPVSFVFGKFFGSTSFV